jgi:hypothetical protein
MPPWISLGFSALALTVSAVTAWLTLFRRGELRMTPPNLIYFGPDGGAGGPETRRLKVFLRTLLYSTARRGQVVESMFVNVQRGESRQNFSFWAYGNGEERLSIGSGLFVGEDGVAHNHHFVLPRDGSEFRLSAGEYTVRVYAKTTHDREPRELRSVRLTITDAQAAELSRPLVGIFFAWGPEQNRYHAYVEERPNRRPDPLDFLAHVLSEDAKP